MFAARILTAAAIGTPIHYTRSRSYIISRSSQRQRRQRSPAVVDGGSQEARQLSARHQRRDDASTTVGQSLSLSTDELPTGAEVGILQRAPSAKAKDGKHEGRSHPKGRQERRATK